MVKYMVCVDGSKCALAAFHTALSMIQYPRDHLYIISVMEDIKPYMSFAFGGEMDAIAPFVAAQEQIKKEATDLLKRYAKIAKKNGINSPFVILGTGNHIGDVICRAVDKYHIDFLIIGRRGMSTLKRLLVGSTSKYITENANCSVLVVKGEWGPAEAEHVPTKDIVKLEEEERKRRETEDKDSQKEHRKERLAIGTEAAAMAELAEDLGEMIPNLLEFQ